MRALPLALCLAATPVSAEMTDAEKINLACATWGLDRLVIGTTIKKHREIIAAMDDIASSNLTKPLAKAVANGLGQMVEITTKNQTASNPIFRSICLP